MLRSWQLSALLVGLTLSAAGRADDPVPKTPQEKLEAAIKQLDEKLTKIQNDVASIREKVQYLESNVASANDLIAANKSIAEVRTEIEKLRGELRTSAKPAPISEPAPRDAYRLANGKLRLINDFAFSQEVEVNGLNYMIEPGQTMDVPLPAGSFSFQVLSKHATPQIRNLAGGTTYTVRIR